MNAGESGRDSEHWFEDQYMVSWIVHHSQSNIKKCRYIKRVRNSLIPCILQFTIGNFWGSRVCFHILVNNILVQNSDALANLRNKAHKFDRRVKTGDVTKQNHQKCREKIRRRKKSTLDIKNAWNVYRNRGKNNSYETHISIIEMRDHQIIETN